MYLKIVLPITEKIEEFWKLFKKNPLALGLKMIHYLYDWLVNHIRKEEKEVAAIISCQFFSGKGALRAFVVIK